MTVENFTKCVEHCPGMAICARFKRAGEANLLMTVPLSSSVEFETEDGGLVGANEFFGLPELSAEETAELREAGNALLTAGRNMERLLTEGCDGRPVHLGEDLYICNSSNRGVANFTEDDLQGL